MIAKATAKASGCKFINLQASTLTDMWYGESQKLTAAVFSLAVKLQPCIIFIDEIGECICPDACHGDYYDVGLADKTIAAINIPLIQ